MEILMLLPQEILDKYNKVVLNQNNHIKNEGLLQNGKTTSESIGTDSKNMTTNSLDNFNNSRTTAKSGESSIVNDSLSDKRSNTEVEEYEEYVEDTEEYIEDTCNSLEDEEDTISESIKNQVSLADNLVQKLKSVKSQPSSDSSSTVNKIQREHKEKLSQFQEQLNKLVKNSKPKEAVVVNGLPPVNNKEEFEKLKIDDFVRRHGGDIPLSVVKDNYSIEEINKAITNADVIVYNNIREGCKYICV